MRRILWQGLLRSWRDHAFLQTATLVVLTGTFSVISLFFFLQSNMTRLLSQWGEGVDVAVYLKDSLGTNEQSNIEKFLTEAGLFKKIQFISKDSAAIQFQKQMGHYSPDLLNDPDFGNPLPASFEAHLNENVGGKGQYEKLVEISRVIAALPGVEDVSYGQGWVENYASTIRVFNRTSWIFIIILLIGSLLVVGNTITNLINDRREEIEVYELVGATPAMVRWPFIIEGAILGLLAAAISLGLCYGFFIWQNLAFSTDLNFLGLAGKISFLPMGQSAIVLGMGAWFGAFGAFLSVRQIATGWAAAEGS
jgi:cell division transport system permease protein